MQTRSLKTLTRISRIGSFAQVADDMNTTLSTVSMQMKALEESLGVSLFDRNFRPPKLTPLGRLVARHAETVTSAEAELLNACSEISELAGTYRVGFIATASVRLLPNFLSNAADLAPLAEFELETALSEVLESRILSGQLDAAVVTASKAPQPGLRYDVLREEKLMFAAPSIPGHPGPEELVRTLPFLQFNPNSGIGKLIESHIRGFTDYVPKKTILLDSVEAIMECVNEGLGFTLLSEPDVRRYASHSVQLIDPDGEGPSRRLVLASAGKGIISKDIGRLANLFG
ncbi:MAG: LysR family transcriptional regulator [Rhizobiaceae bacterium]